MKNFIQQQIDRLGDPSLADMCISRLDGKTSSETELHNAALSASFFGSERLVIVTNALAKYDQRRGQKSDVPDSETPSGKQKNARTNFMNFLSDVPESTILVLLMDDRQKWRSGGYQWEFLTERHFICKWAIENSERAQVIGFALPAEREMPVWIQKKVRELNGRIAPQAAAELASFVGNDTRLAVLEIDKLLSYTNNRQIEVDDVQAISTSVMSATIWNLTDAIGEKDARKALHVLHTLMETMDIRQEIFPMIIWQFRQLLLGCEVVSEGGSMPELMRELHLADFQARKLFDQVRRFKLPQLRWAYRQIMSIEEESKRSSGDLSVLLDQFIIRLCTGKSIPA